MDRARELIHPYVPRPDVIGAYVVGSSTRPFRDAFSDRDIEIVVTDDAYERTPDAERHVLVPAPGEPRRVDHEFYLWPWSAFEALRASRLDLFHYPYQHAVVLHDPTGQVGRVVGDLAALPEDVRAERLRVHWLELLFDLGRERRTRERGAARLDAGLVHARAVAAAVKVLFLAKRSWVATPHWTTPELRVLGVPEPVLEALAAAAAQPGPETAKALLEGVRGVLEAEGVAFHRDGAALVRWAYLGAPGRAAFERWGS